MAAVGPNAITDTVPHLRGVMSTYRAIFPANFVHPKQWVLGQPDIVVAIFSDVVQKPLNDIKNQEHGNCIETEVVPIDARTLSSCPVHVATTVFRNIT